MFPQLQPLTPVCRHLLIINALMFFGTFIVLGDEGRLILAAYQPGTVNYRPFQMATHMFMHANFNHIFFNMLSLYIFGGMIESVWGPKRFLAYYLTCGIGGYVTYIFWVYWRLNNLGVDFHAFNGQMMGASGAVFGLYSAVAFLFADTEIQLLFPPIPIKGKYLALIFCGIELFAGFGGSNDGIAHFAHLGGALFGGILIYLWYYTGVKGR